MGISDMVAENMTTLYLVAIAAIKATGLVRGQCYGSLFILLLSTAFMGVLFVGALIWDLSRKDTKVLRSEIGGGVNCGGGICWHGVAERSPASQVRFRLPQRHLQNL